MTRGPFAPGRMIPRSARIVTGAPDSRPSLMRMPRSVPSRSHRASRPVRSALSAVKATVPIWKREVWADGSAWGLDGHPIDDPDLNAYPLAAGGTVFERTDALRTGFIEGYEGCDLPTG